jgi:hypothetical protein
MVFLRKTLDHINSIWWGEFYVELNGVLFPSKTIKEKLGNILNETDEITSIYLPDVDGFTHRLEITVGDDKVKLDPTSADDGSGLGTYYRLGFNREKTFGQLVRIRIIYEQDTDPTFEIVRELTFQIWWGTEPNPVTDRFLEELGTN